MYFWNTVQKRQIAEKDKFTSKSKFTTKTGNTCNFTIKNSYFYGVFLAQHLPENVCFVCLWTIVKNRQIAEKDLIIK